jgi:hypothetical protein
MSSYDTAPLLGRRCLEHTPAATPPDHVPCAAAPALRHQQQAARLIKNRQLAKCGKCVFAMAASSMQHHQQRLGEVRSAGGGHVEVAVPEAAAAAAC